MKLRHTLMTHKQFELYVMNAIVMYLWNKPMRYYNLFLNHLKNTKTQEFKNFTCHTQTK